MKEKPKKNHPSKAVKPAGVEGAGKKNIFRAWLMAAFIVAVTYVVFSPSLKCGFVNWDDPSFILKNPEVVSESVPLKKIFIPPVLNHADYYPLTMLTLAWNYQLGKLNPAGYHAWNLWLHLMNTALVFFFIFLLAKRNLLMAFIVSLFFGIHPMHVESVTWVTERKDVLYAFLFLSGLLAYLRYRESGKTIWYVFALLLFIFSCLSKGAAIVFPAVLLLVDYFLNIPWKRKIFVEKIPFFLFSIGIAALTFIMHKHSAMKTDTVQATSINQWLFSSYGAVMYIVKMFVPYKLSILYLNPEAHSIPPLFYVTPFILLLILGITIYLFVTQKQKPIVFGMLFYFITIALMLQVVPTGGKGLLMADRYSYVPHIGLLFVIAYVVNLSWEEKTRLTLFRYPLAVLLITGAFIFSFQTYAHTLVWKNGGTLWTDVINKYSDEPMAYVNRAQYLQESIGDDDRAFQDYNKALELNPYYTNAYNNRAMIYSKRGQPELALVDFTKAITLDSTYAAAWCNRGKLFSDMGKDDSALNDYNKAIELDPLYSVTYNNRGAIYEKQQQLDLALSDFSKAIELNPSYFIAYNNRGKIYGRRGQFNLALTDFSKAVELNPAVTEYQVNRSAAENDLRRQNEIK